MKNFRFVLCIFIPLALLSCLGGVDVKQKITILLPKSVSAIPLMECNGCTIEGITIKTVFYTDHILAMAEIMTGKKDMIMTGCTHGWAQFNAHQDILHIVTPVWGVASLVAYSKRIKTVKDLEGMRVLVPFPGSPLDVQFRVIAGSENMKDKIGIDYAPVRQAVPLLLNRKADAVCVPEPLASTLVHEHDMTRVFVFSDKWEALFGYKYTPQVSLFAKREFTDRYAGFCAALIRETDRHIARLPHFPLEKVSEYCTMFSISEAVFQKAIDNTLFSVLEFHDALYRFKTYINDINGETTVTGDFFFSCYE